jgi:hypothetical protein
MADYSSGVKTLNVGVIEELGQINAGSSALGKVVELMLYTNQPNITFYMQYDRAGNNLMWTEDSDSSYTLTGTRSHYKPLYFIYKGETRVQGVFTGATPAFANASYEANIKRLAYTNEERVWATSGVSSSDINRSDCVKAIMDASAEVDTITMRKYYPVTVTEKHYGNSSNSLMLDNSPVISLNTLTISGTSVTPSKTDVILETGKLVLTTDAEQTIFQTTDDYTRNIIVNYTHGYATLPDEIVRLTDCIAGIKILVELMGGYYIGTHSYSIQGVSESLGDPHAKLRATLGQLETERDMLMANIQKRIYVG